MDVYLKKTAINSTQKTSLLVPICFLLLIIFIMNTGLVFAVDGVDQTADKKASSNALTLTQLTAKIEDIEKRIAISKNDENEQTANKWGVTLFDLTERTGKLRSIQSTYERLLTALKKKTLEEEKEALLHERLREEKNKGFALSPPFNLSVYDSMLDDLAVQQQQKETSVLAAKLSKKSLEELMIRNSEALKEQRSIKERLHEASAGVSPGQLSWDLDETTLEIELLEALIKLEKVHYDNLLKQIDILDLKTEVLKQNISWVQNRIKFDENDSTKRIEELANARTDLENRIRGLIRGQEATNKIWLEAQNQISEASNGTNDPVNEAFLKEREAWRETYQAVLEQEEEKLRLLEHQAQTWRLRYALVKGEISHEEQLEKKEETERHIKNVNRLLTVQQSYHSNLQSRIVSLEKKLSEKDLAPSIRPHLLNHIKAMQKLSERQLDYTSVLLATEQMDRRALNELARSLNQVNLKERVLDFKEQIKEIWDFEIWVIDTHPLTVKKLFGALVIFFVGIVLARFFLGVITKRLIIVMGLKETTASTMQKIFTYSAYLLVLLFALRIVNIPLAAFAFLGGAIAIGVGFGAQNILNNFISGFIMMAERPINIGDLIEVEGLLGKVEQIGGRCTRVRTGSNIRILVPNSSFLEKNITNWTISDPKIRTKVTVGVVYGSDVQKVESLLMKTAIENTRIIQSPEPFVLFTDFGDNALIFEIYFWINVRQVMEKLLIESMIRFRIDQLFREAGIIIAFPQRDVHLDSQKPVEIRLLKESE